MAQLPDGIKRLSDWLRRIEERVRRLENRSPFAGTGQEVIDTGQVAQEGSVTISAPGNLIVDGGDVLMLEAAPSAVEKFRLGTMPFGDRGIIIRRDDGTEALGVRDILGAGRQTVQIVDKQGRLMFFESVLSFSGFDAPYMPIPFHPTDYTSGALAQSTSSASFVATHEHRGIRQNPALKPGLMVKCSDGTTAGEVRVWDAVNSVYLGGFLGTPAVHTVTVPAGTTSFTLFEFSSPLALPDLMGDDVRLEIHVRRTAGAGSVSVAPVRSIGSGF